MIFDECHRGVSDHPMRSIMQRFQDCPRDEQPRVLGLTATLLNGNVKLNKLEETISVNGDKSLHPSLVLIKTHFFQGLGDDISCKNRRRRVIGRRQGLCNEPGRIMCHVQPTVEITGIGESLCYVVGSERNTQSCWNEHQH